MENNKLKQIASIHADKTVYTTDIAFQGDMSQSQYLINKSEVYYPALKVEHFSRWKFI